MLANEPNNNVVRRVDINQDVSDMNESVLLNLTFRDGQNEEQPKENQCSVSAGDVIDLDGKLFLICDSFFKDITDQQLADYEKMDRHHRLLKMHRLSEGNDW